MARVTWTAILLIYMVGITCMLAWFGGVKAENCMRVTIFTATYENGLKVNAVTSTVGEKLCREVVSKSQSVPLTKLGDSVLMDAMCAPCGMDDASAKVYNSYIDHHRVSIYEFLDKEMKKGGK